MALRLTIGIATWNRAELLAQTLASLRQVRLPEGVTAEVLICDNHSTDTTRDTVERELPALAAWLGGTDKRSLRSLSVETNPPTASPAPSRARYLYEPKPGKSHALNRILCEASGDWLLFTDDDAQLAPDWIEAYLAGMQRYPRAAVLGGSIEPWLTRPLSRRAAFLLREYPGVFAIAPVTQDTRLTPEAPWGYGVNLAFRADAIPPEGFDVVLGPKAGNRVDGEDVGMVRRIVQSGHEGWLLADAKVRHLVHPQRLGLRYFCKWQTFIGQAMAFHRGKPQPGKLGVPWWAWREFARRTLRAAARWRPAPTRRYYDAVAEAAQWWGYLRYRDGK